MSINFPVQVPSVYSNPQGDLVASGLYRSYITQKIANNFPSWMQIRDHKTSLGQQLIASEAILLEWLQGDLEYNIRSKFLITSPLDDIDVLYRVKVPSTVNLLNPAASGLTCIAAPQGYLLGSSQQIYIQNINNLEDFYYNQLPTRIEVISSGAYMNSVNGTSWNSLPSGILDTQSKLYDKWRSPHSLTWCASTSGFIQKQDAVTMESYETYTWNDNSVINDMWYNNGYLWTISRDSNGSYISLLSSKTQVPQSTQLDYLARFNFNTAFPSGITLTSLMIDSSGYMWASDINNISLFGLAPRYDYFILDPTTRQIYFRENYINSGVFITNN